MLRVLAQREEGYEDMAALMGITVEELRARVKEALSEVEEDDVPAASTEEPPPPAPPPAVTSQPVEPPRPQAPEPTPSPPPAAAPPPTQSSPARPGRAPRAPLSRLWASKDRGALIGLGAGVLVVLALVVVLLVAGAGDSSDSGSNGGDSNFTAAEESKFTQAVLEPTNGGDASGRALFGRYKKNVILQVEAEGLDSPPAGKSYTVWLYSSPKIALRLNAATVDDSGRIATQLAIPAQLLSYVASGAFDQVDISLTSNAAYKAVLAKAKAEQRLPPYTGESVLRGAITGPAIRGQ